MQLIPMTVLLLTGLLFIYGTGQQIGGFYAELWGRQVIWIGIGAALWLTLSLFDYRNYGLLALCLYPVGLFLLIYVLFAGVKLYGARRWLDIAGISVQPSEIAKLLTIVLAAWLFSLEQFRLTRWRSLGILFLLAAVPGFLIFREPNLSTALTLVFGVFVVAFAAGLRLRMILIGLLVLAICAPVGYSMLRPYHKARIHVFLKPDSDPLNKGWNQRQSELAVGSGGLTGKGFMQGTQNQLGYLPPDESRPKGRRNGYLNLLEYKNFCPYTVNLDAFRKARERFSIQEWMDVLLGAIDYNPDGYADWVQKHTMLTRLLPFIEPRINLVELAPKGTGKSYLFGRIGKYGWLVSGGTLSRAKMFYDVSKRQFGLVAQNEFVALDEIQSIQFPNQPAFFLNGFVKSFQSTVRFYCRLLLLILFLNRFKQCFLFLMV